MSGFHLEKLNSLAPRNGHLDDRVRCDWFWTPDATAGLKQKVIKNRPSSLNLYHFKGLGSHQLKRALMMIVSGDASRCYLPSKRDWLLQSSKLPRQMPPAHDVRKCSYLADSSYTGFCLIPRRHGSQLQYRRTLCKRAYSTSNLPAAQQKKKTSNLPDQAIAPPKEWRVQVFEEALMKRALVPSSYLPDYAMQVKTIPGVVPQLCTDEAVFLLNYDPYEYVKARPLFERKVVYGSKTYIGDRPSIWIPYDHAIYLMHSLPLLARFFHEQDLCLPRLTLSDLVITGAGTFRLRGTAIKFRECSPENIQDVYKNICSLFKELVVVSVGPEILKELPSELGSLLEQMEAGKVDEEYLICYHTFFIPISNKCTALLRILDKVIELPGDSDTMKYVNSKVAPQGVDWHKIAESNAYLGKWYSFREYGGGRKEYFIYLRAVICHKLKHKLPAEFVDFLLYAVFHMVLRNLQKAFWDLDKLREFHMEELYLHNSLRTGFVSYKDVSLVYKDTSGVFKEDEFPYGYKMLEERRKNESSEFVYGRRLQEKSLLSKMKLITGGVVLEKHLSNDMLVKFVSGVDVSLQVISDLSEMTGAGGPEGSGH